MSSTTALTPVYPAQEFESHVTADRLTYACVPIADICALLLTAVVSEALRYLLFGRFSPADISHFPLCLLVMYAVFVVAGLYPGFPIHPIEEFRLTLRAISVSFLIIICGTSLLGSTPLLSKVVFLFAWVLASVLVPLGRHIARHWCSRQPWWGIPTVILGERKAGMRILEMLQSNRRLGLRPIAILFDPLCSDSFSSDPSSVFCGELSHSTIFARSRRNCYAILATPSTGSERVSAIFTEHAARFRRVLVIPDLFGLTSLAVKVRDLHGFLGLESDRNLTRASAQLCKRLCDLLVCLLLLPALLPLLLLIAIAVRRSSPGPIFYWQNRIGREGKEFRLWKFRSMVMEADAVLQKHLQEDELLREEWQRDHKLKKDPRVTRIGALLRKSSLDEIPQLWNVFCGEMSLVGPRPIRHPEVEKYGSIFDQYRRVTPGLTGMWQISGRNNTTYKTRTQLDDYYVRNWSISLDLYILLRTLKTIVLREGAY